MSKETAQAVVYEKYCVASRECQMRPAEEKQPHCPKCNKCLICGPKDEEGNHVCYEGDTPAPMGYWETEGLEPDEI